MILTNKPFKTKPPAAKHEFKMNSIKDINSDQNRTEWKWCCSTCRIEQPIPQATHSVVGQVGWTHHYTSLWYLKSDRTMELPFRKLQVLAQKAKWNPIPALDQQQSSQIKRAQTMHWWKAPINAFLFSSSFLCGSITLNANLMGYQAYRRLARKCKRVTEQEMSKWPVSKSSKRISSLSILQNQPKYLWKKDIVAHK